jgi:hypothetical protein
MLRCTIALILAAAAVAADPGEAIDQWYVGELGGQPTMSIHLVSSPVEGGGRSTLAELAVVLRRPFGGKEARIEMRQRQELTEDAEGRIVRFRIESDENGSRTIASGQVRERTVVAEIARQGRIAAQEIALPDGVELLGMIAGQQRMAAAVAAARQGEKPTVRFAGVELVSHRLVLAQSSATYEATDAQGNHAFTVRSDLMPVPSQVVVDPRGDLVRMAVDLTIFKIVVTRAPGAVALLGGTVDAEALVAAAGETPRGRARERYRLPAGAVVPADAFQDVEGDQVLVRREATPTPLDDPAPLLAREPQIEIDDPALRAWVEGLALGQKDRLDLAETLRVAVRSHITVRDLGTADGTALDTFRNRRGDCTEHANLLCAALRIAGIPARVEVGLVRPPDAGGWVGHAWVSAWIDGAWRHLDAAYPGIARSNYIRLASTTGIDGGKTAGAMIGALASVMGRTITGLGGE